MVGEEFPEHLDVARYHLPPSGHLRIWFRTGRQALAVCNPQVLANQHVAAVLCLPHGVFFAAHLGHED
jgi:hypothetical protein